MVRVEDQKEIERSTPNVQRSTSNKEPQRMWLTIKATATTIAKRQACHFARLLTTGSWLPGERAVPDKAHIVSGKRPVEVDKERLILDKRRVFPGKNRVFLGKKASKFVPTRQISAVLGRVENHKWRLLKEI
jgi:hypothetical protein